MRLMFITIFIMCGTACATAIAQDRPSLDLSEPELPAIYWSNGNSGYLNGRRVPLRILDVDTSQTGAVHALKSRTKCDLNRTRGLEAKAWAADFTRHAELGNTQTYGNDGGERLGIVIMVDGKKTETVRVADGVFRSWSFVSKKIAKPRLRSCNNQGENE